MLRECCCEVCYVMSPLLVYHESHDVKAENIQVLCEGGDSSDDGVGRLNKRSKGLLNFGVLIGETVNACLTGIKTCCKL